MLLFREETLSCFCLAGREDAEQSSSKRDFFVSWSRKLVRWIFLSLFSPFAFLSFFFFVSFSLIVFHFFFFFILFPSPFFHFARNVTLGADAQWESCVEWHAFNGKGDSSERNVWIAERIRSSY